MVCCRWGANVNESVNLLEEKDCHRYVLWSEPMGTVKFERTAKACDLVVDQFKLGSFGGVMFKAMAVGVPICTYLDEYQMRQLYDEVPPVINCKTDEDIVANIIKLIEEPSILEELSVTSRHWIKKNHGSLDTINTQILHYKNYLKKIYPTHPLPIHNYILRSCFFIKINPLYKKVLSNMSLFDLIL
jgi:hypothetical protein